MDINGLNSGLGMRSFQKNAMFSCSFAFFIKRRLHSLRSFIFFIKEPAFFAFFIKERGVFCILLSSLLKNVAFFAFFYVLYRITLRSLRSFMFFIKKHKRTLRSFWFHKSNKNYKSHKKKKVKEWCVLF